MQCTFADCNRNNIRTTFYKSHAASSKKSKQGGGMPELSSATLKHVKVYRITGEICELRPDGGGGIVCRPRWSLLSTQLDDGCCAAAVVPLFYFDLKVYMYAFGLTVLVFWGHWIEIQGDDDDYEKKPGKTRSHSTTSVRLVGLLRSVVVVHGPIRLVLLRW